MTAHNRKRKPNSGNIAASKQEAAAIAAKINRRRAQAAGVDPDAPEAANSGGRR